MKHLSMILFHTIMLSGVIAGHWYGVTEAGNISLVLIWYLVAAAIYFLFTKTPVESADSPAWAAYAGRSLTGLTLLALFMAGWFVSGVALLVSWFLVRVKKKLGRKEQSFS